MLNSFRDSERSWAHQYMADRLPTVPLRSRLPSSLFILEHVALMHSLSADELLAANRAKNVSGARHVAMYIARQLTGESTTQIARNFRKRDHTTVMYACKKIADRIERDTRFSEEIAYVTNLITESYRAYQESQVAEHAS